MIILQVLTNGLILFTLQLILELCKGSVRGSVDTQVIQSYLGKFPISSANADVSTYVYVGVNIP